MRLQPRLALTTLLVCVPLLAALAWSQQHARDHAAEENLSQLALWFMQTGGRTACEHAASTWVGLPGEHHRFEPWRDGPWRDLHDGAPPPPPREHPGSFADPDFLRSGDGARHHWPFPPFELRFYAYDSNYVSQNANAPVVSETLQQHLGSEQTTAATGHVGEPGRDMEVLVRMPWHEGPCARVLVTKHDPHQRQEHMLPMPLQALLWPPALALVSLLLAIGPVVRRMRRLTEEVKRAASAHYTLAVSVQGNDEVGELASSFNEAGKQIREYIAVQGRREKTLRDFLENTTHDVMIPLTVLQGHLSRLQESSARAPTEDAEVIRAASQEAHYIASLVHNLSIAAKLEAGEPQVQRQPVKLNEVVQRAIARHLPVARQKGVTLEFTVPENPVTVQGDVTLIEQALSNVVYNAVRYNNPGGHAAVLLEIHDSHISLRVVDDGPGIDEQDQSRMMQRYARGNAARSRDGAGQGLGLNIAYRVCTAHGWEITLSRSEFGGLQVDFVIPAPQA